MQAATFAEAFEAQYGQLHPNFVASSWRQATTQAHAEFKFLLVYIHSPEHEVRTGLWHKCCMLNSSHHAHGVGAPSRSNCRRMTSLLKLVGITDNCSCSSMAAACGVKRQALYISLQYTRTHTCMIHFTHTHYHLAWIDCHTVTGY